MSPPDPRRPGDGWIIQAVQAARTEADDAHKRLRVETNQIWLAIERKREKDEDAFTKILISLAILEEARKTEQALAVRRASLISVSVSAGIGIVMRIAEWWARHP